MALTPGSRLGVYEITAPIGAGGMGQVWRATDTTLGRQVAIKILPDAFAADLERVGRFEREAKTLASLNHPHIAAIYGFEKSAGTHALVMELVEGEDLSRRIARGAIPLDEARPIAMQIAEALAAAHDLGIIHRDLKPANIKIRDDGTVKVLDFGLAKALDTDAASASSDHSPTITTPAMTQAGMILGTAAYMSPEQARGKGVDKRCDVWAFGAVLYEMLTGTRPFVGEDTTEVIAAVVKTTPDWSAVPADVPRPLVTLIQRCLEKDRKTRVGDIAVARFLLANAETLATPAVALPVRAPERRPRLWMSATAAMAMLAGFASWGWLTPAPPEPRPLTHFTTAAPQGVGINPIAVSRDGSRLAFTNTASNQIYVRAMDDPVAKPVPGTQGGQFPAFSPDGQSLAFIAGTAPPLQLKKVPIAGGASLTLASDITAGVPMTWGDDDNILLGGTEIRRVSAAGGKPVAIAKADTASGDLVLATPQLLPGGKDILATVVTTKGFAALRVVAVDVATGNLKVLLDGVGETWFVPTGRAPGVGHLVYALNGSLFAAAFNAATLQVGPAAPVLEGLRSLGGLTQIGFSRSGTLAYPGRDSAAVFQSTLIWADRQGTEQPLTAPSGTYASPRISPDGGRVAFGVTDLAQSVDAQVWVHDLARGTTTRLTFERNNMSPVWTPDGKRLVYMSSGSLTSQNGTLTSLAADGSGQPVTLTDDVAPLPMSVSPDSKLVIGVRARLVGDRLAGRANDIWVLPLDGGAKPQPFLDNRFTRGNLQFSPDGKWVAHESNETGRNEVYVVPFPGLGGKTQVSTDGGTQPRWNRNGRELFFRNGARMMAVDVETGAVFRAGTARVLFEKVSSDYDVTPDGRRFLMLKPAASGTDSGELHVIVNWFDDLRRRVPLEK